MKLGKRIVGILLAAVMLCSVFTVYSSASGDYGSSFDSATTLEPRGTVNSFFVYGELETSGDADYFKFTATKSGVSSFTPRERRIREVISTIHPVRSLRTTTTTTGSTLQSSTAL